MDDHPDALTTPAPADDTIALSSPQPDPDDHAVAAPPAHHAAPQDIVAESVAEARARTLEAISTPMEDESPEALETAPRTSEDIHPVNDEASRRNTLELAAALEADDNFFSRKYTLEPEPVHQSTRETIAAPEEDAQAAQPVAHELEIPSTTDEVLSATTAEEQVLTPAEKPELPSAAEPLPMPSEEPIPAEESGLTTVEEPAPVQEPTSTHAGEAIVVPAEESIPEPRDEPESADAGELVPPLGEEGAPTPIHEQPDIETIDTEALHETNPAAEIPEENVLHQHYEHQGETTAFEQAAQEKADAPLAEDTGSPSLDWGAAESTFDLGEQTFPVEEAQSEALPDVQPEPSSFAHEEAEKESTNAVEQSAPDLDWGAADADDFNLGLQKTEAPKRQSEVVSHQDEEESAAAASQQIAVETTADLDWGTTEDEDFNFGTTSEPAATEPVQAEVPDIAYEGIGKQDVTTTEQSVIPDLDWGGAGDENFNIGASQEVPDEAAHLADQQEPTEKDVQKAAENKEEDLNAMWAEALADDDLLDDTPAASGTVDPSAFFLDDDDEGFLDDAMPQANQNGAASVAGAAASTTTNKYAASTGTQGSAPTSNLYAPHNLQTANLAQQGSSAHASPYSSYASGSPYSASAPFQQQPPARPSMSSSAQSFADKSKGGYASPYDLPEDIVKPKRRAPVHSHTTPMPQPKGPPPRSSSMYSNPSSPALPSPSNMATASMTPPMSSSSTQPTGALGGPTPSNRLKTLSSKPSTGDFFEELPVVPKPRPAGRYNPEVIAPTPPPPHAPPQVPPPHNQFQPAPPQRQASLPIQSYAPPMAPPVQRPPSTAYAPPTVAPIQRPASTTYAPPTVPHLHQPERLDPFPDVAAAPSRPSLSAAPPAAASRYSPAPPAAPGANLRYSPAPPAAPAAASRYSPAPPVAHTSTQNRYSAEPTVPLPKPAVLPFAPRTSSPLAYHSTPQQEQVPPPRPSSSGSQAGQISARPSIASVEDQYRRPSLDPVHEAPVQEYQPFGVDKPATPPPSRSVPSSVVGSPKRRSTANYTPQSNYAPKSSYTPQSNYAPQYQTSIVSSPPQDVEMPPVRRAQSQSPGATMKGPKLATAPIERPASVNGLTSPTAAVPSHAPNAVATKPRRRTFSRDLTYVKPTDELAMDPLERWKGAPILKWGLGGTVLSTFPKHIPRYGTGTAGAMIKCTPGEVKLQNAKELYPLAEPIVKFPGPLKPKSKKKEVLSWLKSNIESMEKDYQSKIFNGELSTDSRVRFEEKTLLWKILEVFVEHDGHLEGSDTIDQAVRKVLAPEGSENAADAPVLTTAADLIGQTTSTGSAVTAEPIDPQAVDQLRAHLLKGDREKATWDAVDKRLWGHAMLISSTLSKDTWKQVVQEFVRQEVQKVSGSNQSLAALYEVFAGNWEESIDELVPVSARAGFQMVSKTDRSGANTNALEGLNRWRETLLLVVSNRSEGDNQALVALGKLLAGYGRTDAAHICFLFARSTVIFGGADDPNTHVVLLGADHIHNHFGLGKELEPILLTEIYEFATTLSSTAAPPVIPHLQAYKLARAFTLAEYGYKTEAQAYCDAITAAMKSTTRLSPYYNATLVSELDDLIKRLSQSPKDGSSSWISKPTMGKVSSSVWSSFNKFVAGEDDRDAGAAASSAPGDQLSPFAKMAGDTPTVSRSPSVVDLHSSYPTAATGMTPSSTVAGSRYAPSAAGPYAPRTSLEQPSRYAPQNVSPYAPSRSSMETAERPESMMDPLFTHQETPPSSYKPSSHYAPKPANIYPPAGAISSQSSPNLLGSPYTPTTANMGGMMSSTPHLTGSASNLVANSGSEPSTNNFGPPLNSYEPPTGSNELAASSYEPPTSSYEPPTSSYQPYKPEPESEEAEEKPKKKSFMDDDDDDELERRATALKSQQKAEADRIAEENFRKAAEADAAKSKEAPKKSSGWLGGWFKKSDDSPKPIRAKLGEESSFYYDPDLKKWINKKAGADQPATPAATPPPPKGPPGLRGVASTSNLAAAAGGPPKGLGTPPPMMGSQMRSTSMPPPAGGPPMGGSAPGSRSATPAGGESPAGGEGAGATLAPPGAGGPPSRPPTSMSNASSIDDLLGVPAPRKGGAAKKGKRGGRYVDVMAK